MTDEKLSFRDYVHREASKFRNKIYRGYFTGKLSEDYVNLISFWRRIYKDE